MDNKNLQVGSKLKSKRLELGIKQESLANELNISQAALSRIENGKEDIGINKLQQAASILNTPIHYFTSDPINITQEANSYENSQGVYIEQRYGSAERVEEYKDLCKQKDAVIDVLQQEIARLQKVVDSLSAK